jgi:hypothetical protein
MPEFSRGECRSCGAAVSYFALACPNCRAPNQPNPVATISALLAVLLVGGVIALGAQVFHHNHARQAASDAPAPPSTDTSADNPADYGWIVKAMAECEEEAKGKADALRFLILPVAPTGMSLPGWSPNPIADVGSSAKLLSSTDALIGLRNRALALYQKPLTFVVSDPKTETVYRWKPAVGVAALNTRDLSSDNLKLGFEMPDVAHEIAWGPTVGVKKESCYWINLLVLAAGRSGRGAAISNYAQSRSFSSPL